MQGLFPNRAGETLSIDGHCAAGGARCQAVLAACRSLALSLRSKRRDLVKAKLKTIEIASSREALLAMTLRPKIY
jgi:hypothetical protein